MALSIIGYILLCLAMFAGLLITPLGLPGNWLIVGCGAAYGFATDWANFGWLFLVLLVAAALAGEVIEAISAAVGAKKYGASGGAMVAAIIGSIVGLAIGSAIVPILGTIVGGFAGAFLGAFLYEYSRHNDRQQALRVGLGAFLGRTAAVVAKESIGVIMVGAIVYQILS